MKKGQMLKFLFYAILGLIIFVPTAMFASKFLKINDKARDSFNSLASTIEQTSASLRPLRDGEIASNVVYMDSKSIIVGFSKQSNQFESHFYSTPDDITSAEIIFQRPKECIENKACMCLCTEYDSKSSPLQPQVDPCSDPYCKSFNNIDFVSQKIGQKWKDGSPKLQWMGGFLYLRDVPGISERLEINDKAVRTFYIQRINDLIDVCLESPCIDLSKAQISPTATSTSTATTTQTTTTSTTTSTSSTIGESSTSTTLPAK